MPAWLRSVVSIVVGFIVFYAVQGACTLIAARIFDRSFDEPTGGYLLGALAYTFLSALLGGYVTARVASRSPVAHGVGTALLMLPLMALNLRKGFGGQETWFVIVRSIGTPLFAVLGAALDNARHRKLSS